MADEFRVLGDLTERNLGAYTSPARKLIVRMFVGGATFDEEMDFASPDEITAKIEARMKALHKTPNKKALAEAKLPPPALDHGHAIEVPE